MSNKFADALKDYTFEQVCQAFADYIETVGQCEGVTFVNWIYNREHKNIAEKLEKEIYDAGKTN